MKIAQVNDVANVPSTLAKGLQFLGHTVEVFPLKLVGARRPTWVKALLLPWRWQELRRLNQQIRAGQFQIIHLHFAYLGWAGILGKYDYFLHCHGTDVRTSLYDPFRRPMIVRSLKRAKRAFYSTPDLREHVTSVRPDAVFIPNPIDTDQFRPAAQPEGRLDRRPRVLFISALSRVKGVERAFQVIDLLQKQVPGVELAVVGFGDQAQHYTRWPGITVLPWVPYADVPQVIQGFDVVVGQLRLGILSMSELECMACGKPVVGEFRYPDTYDKAPPILTGDAPEEWATQVIRLLDSATLRASVGERSREWVVEHHDYRQVARLTEGYYAGTGA